MTRSTRLIPVALLSVLPAISLSSLPQDQLADLPKAAEAFVNGRVAADSFSGAVLVAAKTVGYIVGAYAYGTGAPDVDKFILVRRREPGKPWRIVADMDNGNGPR